MHWEFLPKVIHNKEAIREYEREESRRLGRWLKFLIAGLPILLIILWFLFR